MQSTHHTSVLFSQSFTELLIETAQEEIKTTSAESLKEYYLKCFEMAAVEGIEKDQISKTIYRKLNKIKEGIVRKINPDASPAECRIGSSWYYECAKTAGVIDLDYSHGTEAERQDSSYIEEQKFVNETAVAAIKYTRSICNVLESEFKNFQDQNGQPLELSTIIDKKYIDAFFTDMESLGKMAVDLADHKTVVPLRAHALFKTALQVENSILSAGRALLHARLAIMDNVGKFLTHKQASKFLRGKEKPQLPIYAPKNRDESIYLGWYGTQCSECGSWRTQQQDAYSGILMCYDCDAGTPADTVLGCIGAGSCGYLFYESDLDKVRKTGECPRCNKEIRLFT